MRTESAITPIDERAFRRRWLRILLVVILLAGTLGGGGHLLVRSAGVSIDVAELSESSGLAASHRNPGILWSHNDSGPETALFAFTTDGSPVARLYLEGIDWYDWEDLAVGPDAAGDPFAALYLGDIGDNFAVREFVQVHRVDEPDLSAVVPGDPVVLSVPVETFRLTYDDGPRDAETLFIDPRDGVAWVIEKAMSDRVPLYRADLSGGAGTRVLERVQEIDVPGAIGLTRLATGGAISPEADRIVVRTYVAGWVWWVQPGQSIPDAMASEPDRLSLPVMRQGEAVTFSADGERLYVTSEGVPAPLGSVAAPAPGSSTD
ncbi:MAG TPA: hypothetical protein VGT61_06250 [Thermomicrobiales bacterium]|jgi:hypothetical protein|nr:hypothetical protein [Thermomicrobiales bacterium]